MASLTEASLRSVVPKLVPPLTGDLYKGDMGRIAVVGGCREYTGAPYFAAISALKLGADLSHVFTTKSAASVIKSYSPELIVHQSLYESESSDSNETHLADKSRDVIQSWFSRLDAIVIGPGLGQDPLNSACAKLVLRSAKEHNLPLILDADSLYLITKDRTLVQGYSEAVLTPNVNELRRLAAMMKIPTVSLTPDSNESRERIAIEVASGLCGPIVVSKGSFDVITNGEVSIRCTEPSSPRRCGGQGDVLSGSAAVFASWSKRISKLPAAAANASPLFIAAYAACLITRRAARSTFAEKGRSMVASDLIDRLASALDG